MGHHGHHHHGHHQEEKHKNHEHLAEAVALGSAAFAAYEHHKVKVDPQHAGRHRREEHIAEAVALGAGGYALHEHHKVRHDHQQQLLQGAPGYYPAGYPVHGHKHEKKHHHGLFH
ncbi:unnamed protein product [Calypogeia fissa]